MKNKLRKFISLALTLVFAIGLAPAVSAAGGAAQTAPDAFPDWADVPSWAQTEVGMFIDYGIVKGYTDGMLHPNDQINMLQTATLMSMTFGFDNLELDDVLTEDFSDAGTITSFYRPYINSAVACSAINGSGGRLGLERTSKRYEMFALICKALQLPAAPEGFVSQFADIGDAPLWAQKFILTAEYNDIINGNGSGNCDPNGVVTRAQMFKQLANAIGVIVDGTDNDFTAEGEIEKVLIRNDGAKVQNLTAKQVLISQGVGEGAVWLENSTIEELIVRGGGENSIHIDGTEVVSAKVEVSVTGALRVVSENGSVIGMLTVGAASEDIILDGTFDTVSVTGTAPVVLAQDAQIQTFEIQQTAASASLMVSEGAKIEALTVKAADATMDIAGTVETLSVEGAGAAVTTSGDNAEVGKIEVKADNAVISVPNTYIEVAEDINGTMVGETAVSGGENVVTYEDMTPAPLPEALIGTTRYTTFAEALAAAQDGQTIALLKAISITAETVIPADVTLDLAGKNITVSGEGTLNGLMTASVSAMLNGVTLNASLADLGGIMMDVSEAGVLQHSGLFKMALTEGELGFADSKLTGTGLTGTVSVESKNTLSPVPAIADVIVFDSADIAIAVSVNEGEYTITGIELSNGTMTVSQDAMTAAALFGDSLVAITDGLTVSGADTKLIAVSNVIIGEGGIYEPADADSSVNLKINENLGVDYTINGNVSVSKNEKIMENDSLILANGAKLSVNAVLTVDGTGAMHAEAELILNAAEAEVVINGKLLVEPESKITFGTDGGALTLNLGANLGCTSEPEKVAGLTNVWQASDGENSTTGSDDALVIVKGDEAAATADRTLTVTAGTYTVETRSSIATILFVAQA